MGFTGRDIPSVKVNRLLLKNASAVGVAWGLVVGRGPPDDCPRSGANYVPCSRRAR